MRWLVALLLVTMPAAAQLPSGLDVAIESHAFAYSPEDWKDARPVEDQATLTERISDWNGSLGVHLDVHVRAPPRVGVAGNDWDYRAWLSDGVTEVEGIVTPDPAGRFDARFDVDGQRALPGMAAVPALVPGTWTLRVRATSDDAAGNPVPEGSGQALLETAALATTKPSAGDNEIAGVLVPEGILPHITEVGPDGVWFNRVPQATGQHVAFSAEAPGIAWSAWWRADPVRLPGASLGMAWRTQDLESTELPDASVVAFSASSSGLFIISAVDPVAGGSQVWAWGVSDVGARIDRLAAPAPGAEGPVRIGFALPITPPQVVPGALFAASLDGQTTIASTPLIADGGAHASALLDGSALRAHRGPYRLVALRDVAGAYDGHVVYDRGLDITLDLPTLVAGRPATATVRLGDLGDDGRAERNPALMTNGTLLATTGEASQSTPFEVIEGGTIEIPFTFTPPQAGPLTVTVVVDTGDTYTTVEHAATTMDADAYDKANKPWYDPGKYVPGPPVVLVLVAIALLGRKR